MPYNGSYNGKPVLLTLYHQEGEIELCLGKHGLHGQLLHLHAYLAVHVDYMSVC